MKKTLAFLFLVVGWTSCSNTEDVEISQPTIAFSPALDSPQSVDTRGTVIGSLSQLTDFYVYGLEANGEHYLYGERLYQRSAGSNVYLIGSGNVYYWPSGTMSFYAYGPTEAQNETVGVTATHVEGGAGQQYLTYVVPHTPSAQKDLVWANCIDAHKNLSNVVQLTFSHALSQVVFRGRVVADNLSVSVSSIELCNVVNQGQLNLATPRGGNPWTLGSATDSYTLTPQRTAVMKKGDTAQNTGSTNTNVKNTWDLTVDNPLLILPQTLTPWVPQADTDVNGHYVHIRGRVWYTESGVDGGSYIVGSADADGDMYAPLTFSGDGLTADVFEPGRRYEFTINFGAGYNEKGHPYLGGEITFTPTIASGWSEPTPTDITM